MQCVYCGCNCDCAAKHEIISYRFSMQVFPWGEKKGGKVSARSEQRAKELVRDYLCKNCPNDVAAIANHELLNYITVTKYERSEEVFEFWEETAGGE